MSESKFISGLKKFMYGFFNILVAFLNALAQFIVLVFTALSDAQAWEEQKVENQHSGGFLYKEGGNMKLILLLSSILIKADGKVQQKELEYVRKKIEKDHGVIRAESWMIYLDKHMGRDFDLNKLCKKVNRRFSQSSKIQLLHFLSGLVTRDGMLKESEFVKLKEVCRAIRLPFITLKSILALYDFISEAQYKANQERKSKKQTVSPKWRLEKAYAILEITHQATDKEVKKAFRKLAVIHHPDKVSHMGASFQKIANETFAKILEAYEMVKEKRGFK